MPVNDLDGADKSAKLAVINVSPGQKFLARWAREINARPDNRVKSGNLIEPRRRSPFFSSKVARRFDKIRGWSVSTRCLRVIELPLLLVFGIIARKGGVITG